MTSLQTNRPLLMINSPWVYAYAARRDAFICVPRLIHTCDMKWDCSSTSVCSIHIVFPYDTHAHRRLRQHIATHCNTLQHTAEKEMMLFIGKPIGRSLMISNASLCNTLQHTATHCHTLQRNCTFGDCLQLLCLLTGTDIYIYIYMNLYIYIYNVFVRVCVIESRGSAHRQCPVSF